MDLKTFTACFCMLACFLKVSDAQISAWSFTDSGSTAAAGTASAPAGAIALSINEGQAVGTRLFTAAATSGGTTTYAFESDGNPSSVGSLDTATGAVTLAAGMSLDFETTPSIVFKIKAIEDGSTTLVGTGVVTLSVNDAIVFGQQGYTVCLSSTSIATAYSIGTFASTDALSTQTVAYAITTLDAAKFTVTPATGAVVTAAALDGLEKSQWTFLVTATSAGVGDGTTTVIVALGCSSGAGQIAAILGVLLLSVFSSLFC